MFLSIMWISGTLKESQEQLSINRTSKSSFEGRCCCLFVLSLFALKGPVSERPGPERTTLKSEKTPI